MEEIAKRRGLRARRVENKTKEPLAQWEKELLIGFIDQPAVSRAKRASKRNSLPTSLKPKTAQAAEAQRRFNAELKQSGRTSTGKPRKSRRAIKRELYGVK